MGLTNSAVAYLKGRVADSESVDLTLSREDSPVTLDFAGNLLVTYVIDVGKSYQFVQYRDLDHEGVSAEDLHRIGLENLLSLVEQRDLRVQPYGNIFAVLMGGDFEASLLLLDTVWEHFFRQFIPGDYVAAAPARDVLAFCDSGSAAGLEELGQLIGRTYASCDHLLSNRLYVRRAGAWELNPPV